jgi:hypothetical protein
MFGFLCLAATLSARRVRGLGTGVDVGAAALEHSCFRCRPFLLGRKSRRIMWYAASEPVCNISGCFQFSLVCAVSGSAWTSERRLQNLCLVECRLFLLGRMGHRLEWCAASASVCRVGTFQFLPVFLINWSCGSGYVP